uniref:Annexin n=1 Tax=Gasterosteus aculeatus aculeatus TaxID=481459 RepID=A0AAQ4QL29_GASAC
MNVLSSFSAQYVEHQVKDNPKPKYYGTVTPYPNFNASQDAATLQSAIKSKGVDEDVIIAILVKRNNEQRQKIKVVYEASTGKKLEADLKSVLRSDFEDVCLALLMDPTHYDAHLLRKATKGFGTHEDILVEILATRSNQEIREIKRVFNEVYKTELETVIQDETGGDFTSALLAMLKANKDESKEVDMSLAQKDAEILFEAGEKTKGINISVFIDILTKRSAPQLSKTFQQYATVSDVKLPKALEMELRGDIEKCLIDIVKCSWNTPAFFAEKLHLAMKGIGTHDHTLIRVLVSLKDTKGHYQAILLGLCGAP